MFEIVLAWSVVILGLVVLDALTMILTLIR